MTKKKTNNAGGSATGGGVEFQAAVTAITYVHLIRGIQLSWLEKLVIDIPVYIDGETGGPGDDIAFKLSTGKKVEIQVKKGLHSENRLWDSIIKLAKSLHDNEIDYGVLIVSGCSSKTVRINLCKEIIRIGEGRTDDLSEIGSKLLQKLKSHNLDINKCCKRLRIQTINADIGNLDYIKQAHAELAHICLNQNEIIPAWKTLKNDALDLIKLRGRKNLSSLLQVLKADGIKLSNVNSNSPIIYLEKLCQWNYKKSEFFSIFTISKKLRVDEAWIPLKAEVLDQTDEQHETLSQSLEKYQTWYEYNNQQDKPIIDAETFGRFVSPAIIIGGPGSGKTTLFKRITRKFSIDGIPVINVKLSTIAARMQNGSSFEESIFSLGLDGFNNSISELTLANISNWVVLCDGLDECGNMQENVASGIEGFMIGYPDSKFLVTTRPIGYDSSHFNDWRHYRLIPLDTNNAIYYLTNLLVECAPEGSIFKTKSMEISKTELQKEKVKKIISKSPLMLALGASIIIKNGNLEDSKEKLFEQIFILIYSIPVTRNSNQPIPNAVLIRYIEILGWCISMNSLDSIDKIHTRCSKYLALETEEPELVSKSNCEKHLQHWENIGLIERIGFSDEKIIVFVHKSFGEFAAARYLLNLSPEEQTIELNKLINKPEWIDVIHYSAHLGLSNNISEIIISSDYSGKKQFQMIFLATELVAESDNPPTEPYRNKIIEEAINIIASNRRKYAIKLSKPLIKVARRFPDEIGPLVSKYFDHEQTWTSITMWTVALMAGKDYFKFKDLSQALKYSIEVTKPIASTINGRLNFRSSLGRDLHQNFTLKAVETLLQQRSSEKFESISLEALNNTDLHTVNFVEKANEIANSNNMDWVIGNQNNNNNRLAKLFITSVEYQKASQLKYKAIFDALDITGSTVIDTTASVNYLHLSAFVKASGLGEVLVDEVWDWEKAYNKSAFKETIVSYLKLTKINAAHLRKELFTAKKYINESLEHSFFQLTKDVDPPEIDWTIASKININFKKVESAMYHPSQWVILMSANLLFNGLSNSDLIKLIKRLFNKGKRVTLSLACAMTQSLDDDLTTKLIYERLSKPFVSGCEHLFELLEGKEIKDVSKLFELIYRGLNNTPEIAFQASKLIISNLESNPVDLFTNIETSMKYWTSIKNSKSRESGVVPPCPRANLFKSMLHLEKFDYIKLKPYICDSDSDVSEVAINQLKKDLKLSNKLLHVLLKDITNKEIPHSIISDIINDLPPLSTEDLILWESLLSHADSSIRYNAMKILQNKNTSIKYRERHLTILVNDEDQAIRDRAYEIQEELAGE